MKSLFSTNDPTHLFSVKILSRKSAIATASTDTNGKWSQSWKISNIVRDPAKNPVGPAQGIDPATEECKIGTVHISMYETRQNNRV